MTNDDKIAVALLASAALALLSANVWRGSVLHTKAPPDTPKPAALTYTPKHDHRGKKASAPIRFNNPGAQWPGVSARRWGMVKAVKLKDGQDNLIAVFPTALHGAAAHFDLLNRYYTDRTLISAVKKWSGGNHYRSYARYVAKKCKLKTSTLITKQKLRDPDFAVPFARAMAGHEAGAGYPLSDKDWRRAHAAFVRRSRHERARAIGQMPEPQSPRFVVEYENDTIPFPTSELDVETDGK